MPEHRDHVTDFICAAVVPRDADHASGTLEHAAAILATQPEVASSNIFVAAILGDAAAVRQYLSVSPARAVVKMSLRLVPDQLAELLVGELMRAGAVSIQDSRNNGMPSS